MQYDKNPILLSSMATIQYVPCNPFCHWVRTYTARLNPKLNTSPIVRTTNLVGQTKKDNSKRLAKITQSYIKEFKEDSNILIDKLDHKPTIRRSQQTHRKKKITSNRSPRERGEHCIEIQKERRSHLANNYGPIGL